MIRLCFLACWILSFSTVAPQSTQYALPGQMVTFEPVVKTPPDEILWKHNGNKVVEFNGNEETVYSPFEKRITLDWHAAVLEIKQLEHGDSGKYELDVFTKKGLDRFYFALEVVDRVAKPNILCKMNNGSSGSDKSGNEATLKCSSDSSQSQSVTFEWSQHGTTHPGPILKILLGKEYDDEVYSCTVSNGLSKEMAAFTAKDCYLVRSAGLSAGLSAAIGLIAALCVLGTTVLGIVCCKLKHKACFAKEKTKDVEDQPALDEANDHTSKPLLDRLPTIPSTQRLRPFPGMSGNNNHNRNAEDTDSDEDTGTGFVKQLAGKFEPNPVPKETNEDKLKQTQLPEAEKPFNGNLAQNVKGEADADPHREEPEKEVLAINHLEDHSGATPHDLQPLTASQLPESEKEEDADAANLAPADDQKDEKQDAIAGQLTGGTKEENEKKKEKEENDLREKEKPPTTDERTGFVKQLAGKFEQNPVPTETNKDKLKKTQLPEAEKPFNGNLAQNVKGEADADPQREEPEKEVLAINHLEDHSGATQHDLQPLTASQLPGSEISKDVHKKPGPPVAGKPSFPVNLSGNNKGVTEIDQQEAMANKGLESDQLDKHNGDTKPDLQTSPASENPESEKEEDADAANLAPADEQKDEKQDAIAGQLTGGTKEENEKKKEKEENDLREKEKPATTNEQTGFVKQLAGKFEPNPVPTESEKEEDADAANLAPADEQKDEKQDAIAGQLTGGTKEENEKKKEKEENDLREKEKPPTTDEQTGLVKRHMKKFEPNPVPTETEKEKEEDKKAPNMASADEHKEKKQNATADLVTRETKEENEKEKELNESQHLREKEESPTTDEQTGLESITEMSMKTKPTVPKKSFSFIKNKEPAAVKALRENKVSDRDGLEEHSGATECDLQSSTASETPGLESNTDKFKKTKPPVPKKSLKKNKKPAAVKALRENKVSDRDGLEEHSGATECDLQSSTASETPELDKEADDKAKSAPEVSGSPSDAEPCSPLTQTSPKMAPKNDTSEHVDDSNSEKVTGETE